MNKRYPAEIKAFIAANVQGRTAKELTALVSAEFGVIFTEARMVAYKKNYRLKSGTRRGVKLGLPTKLYPAEVKAFIEGNYVGVGPTEMTKRLNETFGISYTRAQIKAYYGNHRYNSGVTGRFQKGCLPVYAMHKGEHFSPATEFKPGQMPVSYLPVGTEKIRDDGYVWVKVADPKAWKQKHRLIWEEVNGPVPDGQVLLFADGNKQNVNLDNLLLISRRQMPILNNKQLISSDPELTKTGIIVADVYLKITERGHKKKVAKP